MKDCILSLSPEKGKQRSKILLGLNFYGQDYGPNGGTRTYASIRGLVYDLTVVPCLWTNETRERDIKQVDKGRITTIKIP